MDQNKQRGQADVTTAGPAEAGAPAMDDPVPAPVDPGGALSKGYSADPRPEAAVGDQDPVPLAEGPAKHPAVHVRERDPGVQPTGRDESGDYTPNDRLMGSDN